MGVNVYGVVHGIRTFVPILLEQGEEGHVVNTASMAAVTSMPWTGIYFMTKHAVLSLSETLYHELTQQGAKIGVSVVCPEVIATGIDRSDRHRPDEFQLGAAQAGPEAHWQAAQRRQRRRPAARKRPRSRRVLVRD